MDVSFFQRFMDEWQIAARTEEGEQGKHHPGFSSFRRAYRTVWSLRDDNAPTEVDWNLVVGVRVPGLEDSEWSRVMYQVLALASEHYMLTGGALVHSSAVDINGNGFLFLGASSAGKSTIASLCQERGFRALGDDLNFIVKTASGGYNLSAAPSTVVPSHGYSANRPRLSFVIMLRKAKRNELVTSSGLQGAAALWDAVYQSVLGKGHPPAVASWGFRSLCRVAREVPIRELHFRNDSSAVDVLAELTKREPG